MNNEYIDRIITDNNFTNIWTRLLLGDLLLARFNFGYSSIDGYWYGFLKLSNQPTFEVFNYFDDWGGNVVIRPDINRFYLEDNVLKYDNGAPDDPSTVYSQILKLNEEQMLNVLKRQPKKLQGTDELNTKN